MSAALLLREPDPFLLAPVPTAPSAEQWALMSRGERDRFLTSSLEILQAHARLMSEGVPHFGAKLRARRVLGDYFSRIGRDLYLACELPVHYPNETIFSPDLIAVDGVPPSSDTDERMAWVVAEEGRGIDLALEILHAGDPRKDLVENVRSYARMGIHEYFVYDRRHFRLHGHRLAPAGPRRYNPIPSIGGRISSTVLGLELAIEQGRMVFYAPGGALVLETAELVERLQSMVGDLEQRTEQEISARQALQAELEEARAAHAAARAAGEAARAGEEAARAAEEAARAEIAAEVTRREALEAELAELRALLAARS